MAVTAEKENIRSLTIRWCSQPQDGRNARVFVFTRIARQLLNVAECLQRPIRFKRIVIRPIRQTWRKKVGAIPVVSRLQISGLLRERCLTRWVGRHQCLESQESDSILSSASCRRGTSLSSYPCESDHYFDKGPVLGYDCETFWAPYEGWLEDQLQDVGDEYRWQADWRVLLG